MNLAGDHRYVKEEGDEGHTIQQSYLNGDLLNYFSKHDICHESNGYLFVHGGVRADFATNEGCTKINRDFHETLPDYIAFKRKTKTFSKEEREKFELYGSGGPLWTRRFSDNLGNTKFKSEEEFLKDSCEALEKGLRAINKKRAQKDHIKVMVMGHSIQDANFRVNTRCDGQAVLIDIGMSSAYKRKGKNIGFIEIRGPNVYEFNFNEENGLKIEWKLLYDESKNFQSPGKPEPTNAKPSSPSPVPDLDFEKENQDVDAHANKLLAINSPNIPGFADYRQKCSGKVKDFIGRLQSTEGGNGAQLNDDAINMANSLFRLLSPRQQTAWMTQCNMETGT